MGGVRTFGVVACVQQVALTPGDILHYTRGFSELDEGEAIRKAEDFSTSARRQGEVWSGLPCEASFWERKLGPAEAHHL
ncbi:MAG: hypothetical protein NT154_05445 [Verrucomicrobia bacterium]|nr:hypothetical protein [Verrucomicrobiota bacterium]